MQANATFTKKSVIGTDLQISECDQSNVDTAVASARTAFEDGRWRDLAPRERKERLLAFADAIDEQREYLALLETMDVGKPIAQSLSVDAPSAAQTLRWYAEAIDKTYDEIAPTAPDSLALITREPLGVIGAVVPWNYPMIISMWKIAPALAAGNCVLLKPAEQSPLTGIALAHIAYESGIPAGVFNAVPGRGAVTGQALGLHPGVDKIAFTGSPETGARFLSYSAQSNIKQVSLELGGKSPHIILESAKDIDAIAEVIAWGIFYNAGQTCHAGSRVIVHPDRRDELLAALSRFLDDFPTGDPLDENISMGPLIDSDQKDRVDRYLQIAQEDGGQVAVQGRPWPAAPPTFVAPTVLIDVPTSSRADREEIFGPVLTIHTARSEDDAIVLANDTEYGLAAAVWSRDISQAHRVARRVRAGTVWVNTYDASDVATPFGGFGRSGFGRDRSLHALDNYTALKTTWVDLTH